MQRIDDEAEEHGVVEVKIFEASDTERSGVLISDQAHSARCRGENGGSWLGADVSSPPGVLGGGGHDV
jgi:hypothetical protein